MSRFTEAINQEPTALTKGPSCSVGVFAATLEGEDLEDFQRLLVEARAGTRTMTSVERILKRVDVHLTSERLNRHAKGACKCSR